MPNHNPAAFCYNVGCSHLIVGRAHAGGGDYYRPFDAQKIFYEIPEDALVLEPLPIDWTFCCSKCGGSDDQGFPSPQRTP